MVVLSGSALPADEKRRSGGDEWRRNGKSSFRLLFYLSVAWNRPKQKSAEEKEKETQTEGEAKSE